MIKHAHYGNGNITACYVTGGNLVDRVLGSGILTYTASYYLNNDVITSAKDGSTVNSWSEAMNAMNQALAGKDYEWVENEGTDKDTRPLVIKTQPTN